MRSVIQSTWGRAWLASTLLGAAGAACAQGAPDAAPWSVTLGLGLHHGPDYLGSADNRARVAPILLASWRTGIGRFSFGDVPAMPGPFFSYTPYETDSLSVGVGLGRDMGRDDDGAGTFKLGSASLKGMGDVDSTPVFGVHASYRIDRWRLHGLARQAFDRDEGHGGRLADLRLSYDLPVPALWHADVGIGATFADSRYMSAFFGVTPQQSLATGFTAYSAQRGLRDVSLNLGTRYRVDAHVAVIGRANVSQLGGDAKDSPVVKRRTQGTLFGGAAYRW